MRRFEYHAGSHAVTDQEGVETGVEAQFARGDRLTTAIVGGHISVTVHDYE